MSNQSASSLLSNLKQMIKHCREIQDQLNTDKTSLSKNAIENINASNVTKTTLIEKLTVLVNDTYSSVPADKQSDNLLNMFEKSAASFDATAKREIQKLIAEFKAEILKTYEYIATNNQIVAISAQHLKNIRDKIHACQEEIGYVYDSKGK